MSRASSERRKIGEIRPSQLLDTFGVGATVELREPSSSGPPIGGSPSYCRSCRSRPRPTSWANWSR
jgi:hypothetical protein